MKTVSMFHTVMAEGVQEISNFTVMHIAHQNPNLMYLETHQDVEKQMNLLPIISCCKTTKPSKNNSTFVYYWSLSPGWHLVMTISDWYESLVKAKWKKTTWTFMTVNEVWLCTSLAFHYAHKAIWGHKWLVLQFSWMKTFKI